MENLNGLFFILLLAIIIISSVTLAFVVQNNKKMPNFNFPNNEINNNEINNNEINNNEVNNQQKFRLRYNIYYQYKIKITNTNNFENIIKYENTNNFENIIKYENVFYQFRESMPEDNNKYYIKFIKINDESGQGEIKYGDELYLSISENLNNFIEVGYNPILPTSYNLVTKNRDKLIIYNGKKNTNKDFVYENDDNIVFYQNFQNIKKDLYIGSNAEIDCDDKKTLNYSSRLSTRTLKFKIYPSWE